MMAVVIKLILFVLATSGLAWISRPALKEPRLHGFERFFAWEVILILFLMNMEAWFDDPFSLRQIISWSFLIISLALITLGVQAFRRKGKLDEERSDPGLVGIEKTTELVTSGIYKTIRHPFYSSLLFLGWGVFLKQVSWAGLCLAILTSLLLVRTARKEEVENIQYFGEKYREFMKQTKMFIPHVF